MSENQNFKELVNQALEKISKAQSIANLDQLKSTFIGKSSFINNQFKLISQIASEKRAEFGANINKAKLEIEQALKNQSEVIQNKKTETSLNQKIDISLPGRNNQVGSIHLISRTQVTLWLCL